VHRRGDARPRDFRRRPSRAWPTVAESRLRQAPRRQGRLNPFDPPVPVPRHRGTGKIWIGIADGLPYTFVIRDREETFSYNNVRAPIP
jgi:hypothetical protein